MKLSLTFETDVVVWYLGGILDVLIATQTPLSTLWSAYTEYIQFYSERYLLQIETPRVDSAVLQDIESRHLALRFTDDELIAAWGGLTRHYHHAINGVLDVLHQHGTPPIHLTVTGWWGEPLNHHHPLLIFSHLSPERL